jgi:glycosyltransferase involved in cell wall biosynthesis
MRVKNPIVVPNAVFVGTPQRFTDRWASPRFKAFHDLWNELHARSNPTKEWFADWVSRVPNITCGCREWLLKYITDHPPEFDNWPRWTFNLHNAVNAKKESQLYTWEQYQAKWLRWKIVQGIRIGIASVNYESLGGTETFHQTLVPRLAGVIGFASLNDLRGDVDLLGVPSGQGMDAITSLGMQSDTVISWNINWETTTRPKRIITVHHGSIEDLEGNRLCIQGDEIVCVNRDVAVHVRTLTDKPVHCIEPAVDPDRIKPRKKVETNGKKICLWAHRFCNDKRPQLAIAIAKHLPDDWHMVLIGHRKESLVLNDRVTVLPATHPRDWLSVASCFLSTTRFEGFGLSVAEAITAGVPVVSTPTGIASRPGLAITLPADAEPSEWAQAIASSDQHPLPSKDLFSLDQHLAAWSEVLSKA